MPKKKMRTPVFKARRAQPIPEYVTRTPPEPRIGRGEGLVVIPELCRRIPGTNLAIYTLR